MTFLLNSELNHIIFLRLFLFFLGVFLGLYFRIDLKPLLRASRYSDLVDSDTVLLEKLPLNLLLVERGSCLMIRGESFDKVYIYNSLLFGFL